MPDFCGVFQSGAFKKIKRCATFFFCFIGIVFCFATAVVFWRFARPSAIDITDGTYIRLNIDGDVYETRPNDIIGSLTFGNPPTLNDLVSGLYRGAADPRIKGVIGYMTRMPLTLTQIQEFRAAIKAFKRAGKKTVFYAPTIGELGGGLGMYYLASAFDEIRVQPGGEVGVAGIAAETPYFKAALKKIGVLPSFGARYEYKTGADSLSAEKMSAAERENLTAIFNSFLKTMAADIKTDRPQIKDDGRKILTSGPYFAEQALKMKLIDKIEYADVLERELKEQNAEIVDLIDYADATLPAVTAKTPVVAIIPASGVIQFGESVFGGDSYRSVFGAATFGGALRDAAEDEAVKAIVVRLDSPGGGYTSSDAIRREIEHVKTVSQKPVVCSMASTAASGGYFVSLACDKVFADASTLTGSVGVFGGKMVFGDLLKKLNITVDSIEIGKNAGLFSATKDFTPEQRKFFDASLDRVYADFTAKVAERRGFDAKKINQVARGRVFTGAQAKENGMIDEIGGLADAVRDAAKAAGHPESTPAVEFPFTPSRLEMLIGLLNSNTAVAMRRVVAGQNIVPSMKAWLTRMTKGDFRLYFNGWGLN